MKLSSPCSYQSLLFRDERIDPVDGKYLLLLQSPAARRIHYHVILLFPFLEFAHTAIQLCLETLELGDRGVRLQRQPRLCVRNTLLSRKEWIIVPRTLRSRVVQLRESQGGWAASSGDGFKLGEFAFRVGADCWASISYRSM